MHFSLTQNGNTALHIACRKLSEAFLLIMTLLIESGADVDAQNKVRSCCAAKVQCTSSILIVCVQNGSAPLHLACGYAVAKAVELLLEHRANADLENHVCSVDVLVHS